MSLPVLVLWATPRTVSTAFERMMIERGDHTVFDEPFSMPYYFGPSKRSRRFEGFDETHSFDSVLAAIDAARRREPVFVKDMAYHALPYVDDDVLGSWVNTFLLRDPARALPSLARKWPDFTDDEAGYAALAELHERAAGVGPVYVIDSDDLRRDPAGTVGRWCDAVGIDRRPDALRWEPGMRPEWLHWRDWYEAAAASTGFLPPDATKPPPLTTARLRSAVASARPVYEHLRQHRLNPEIA